MEDQKKFVTAFCDSIDCLGVPIEVKYGKDDEDKYQECAICMESLTGLASQVTLLKPCKHVFCRPCIAEIKNYECQMCRASVSERYHLSAPINSIDAEQLNSNDHWSCYYPKEPIIKEYASGLSLEWKLLIDFIFKSEINNRCKGMKGLETLKLERYELDNMLISKGKRYAVLKTDEGKVQVVLCCYFPNLSLRLILSPNDDSINFDADNEYADEVVSYINKQLYACWKAIGYLVNRDKVSKAYIRIFDKVTVKMLLTGQHDSYIRYHKTPMKEQLRGIKECNFNRDFLKNVKLLFPRLSPHQLKFDKYFDINDCCELYEEEEEDYEEYEEYEECEEYESEEIDSEEQKENKSGKSEDSDSSDDSDTDS